jgi:predicted DNA-binding transcriptional regulator AlpA
MWSTTYQTHDGPPTNRLWEDEDIAAYVGFQSIEELIARHPDFPQPVPLVMQGRRWRPSDVTDWIDQLCNETLDAPAKAARPSTNRRPAKKSVRAPEIPAFNLAVIAEQLKEVNHG